MPCFHSPSSCRAHSPRSCAVHSEFRILSSEFSLLNPEPDTLGTQRNPLRQLPAFFPFHPASIPLSTRFHPGFIPLLPRFSACFFPLFAPSKSLTPASATHYVPAE